MRTTFDYDGSAGAVWGHDGMTGPTTLTTLGSVQRGSVEEAEIRYPWRMLKLEARPNFNGAGRWRGGGGIDWRALNEGSDGRMATGSSDGDVIQVKGAQGGQPNPRSPDHHPAGRSEDSGQAAPDGRNQGRRHRRQAQRRAAPASAIRGSGRSKRWSRMCAGRWSPSRPPG